MAKKRSKKRRPPPRRPAQAAASERARTSTVEEDERPTSRRAERREEAKRERERRIKQQRRRERTRRLIRWGVVVLVLGVIAAIVLVQIQSGKKKAEEANQAATRANCAPIETRQDDLDDAEAAYAESAIHEPPFGHGENGVPATAGRHSTVVNAQVYHQAVPEENVLHNLEHAYVVVYYAPSGGQALPTKYVDALESYVGGQAKMVMAPYPGLAHEVDFVAWGKLRACDPGDDGNPDDVMTVLESFVSEFRNDGLAPEPNGG